MKLLLVTDAWEPQTNGVVTTYKNVIAELAQSGLDTEVIHPGLFRSIPCPGYPEIPVTVNPWSVGRYIERSNADFIHVAVEGPLGLAARNYLNRRGLNYTTAFHTRFPEYINRRLPFLPVGAGYRFMRWFHKRSSRILVTTAGMKTDLERHGFTNMEIWGRGVDTGLFRPNGRARNNLDNPVFLYVGRVAVEKSVEEFLALDLPGRKVVVGDGPSRAELERAWPEVHFAGYRYGAELVEYFANADVFVFPSRTDTFGLVMLEAMACGTPVAAYPVPGPVDVVLRGVTGVLDEDLETAAMEALRLERNDCRRYALQQSWAACADIMRRALVPAGSIKEDRRRDAENAEGKEY